MHRWLRVLTVGALAGISAAAGPRSHILRREGASLTDAAIREFSHPNLQHSSSQSRRRICQNLNEEQGGWHMIDRSPCR
jgi:hypothetical protein